MLTRQELRRDERSGERQGPRRGPRGRGGFFDEQCLYYDEEGDDMSQLRDLWEKHKESPEIAVLSKRHQLFVVAYSLGSTKGNPASSYRAAGYANSKNNERRGLALLRDKRIAAAHEVLTSGEVVASDASAMTTGERLAICAEIARDRGVAPRARLAAIRLDAELRGGFKAQVEDIDIVVDLVKPSPTPPEPPVPKKRRNREKGDKPRQGRRGGLRIAT